MHFACLWPGPQSPVMQSKLCGCKVCLRHPPLGLTFENEKKPYTYLPQRTQIGIGLLFIGQSFLGSGRVYEFFLVFERLLQRKMLIGKQRIQVLF